MPSRKDYVAIAAIIDGMRGEYDGDTLEVVASALSGYFATDNPDFDPLRFKEACGFEGI